VLSCLENPTDGPSVRPQSRPWVAGGQAPRASVGAVVAGARGAWPPATHPHLSFLGSGVSSERHDDSFGDPSRRCPARRKAAAPPRCCPPGLPRSVESGASLLIIVSAAGAVPRFAAGAGFDRDG